jgi:hypothetical protein
VFKINKNVNILHHFFSDKSGLVIFDCIQHETHFLNVCGDGFNNLLQKKIVSRQDIQQQINKDNYETEQVITKLLSLNIISYLKHN